MRQSKLTKKKGKMQKKRIHEFQTQKKKPELTQRDYENRSSWIKRRDGKK